VSPGGWASIIVSREFVDDARRILKAVVARVDIGWVEAAGSSRSDTDREFTIVRKGYDPAEVDKRLAEYEEAVRDLEVYSARLKHDLKEARQKIARLEAAEQKSVDRAMLAVFDAKERILERALTRAREIEDEARVSHGLPPTPVGHDEDLGAVDAADPVAVPIVGVDEFADPRSVMERMLAEAQAIRSRLDSGVAAAREHMERMQQDAETRAADLIAGARREVEQLRAAVAETPQVETEVTVNLSEEGQVASERPSRYARNAAGLPRIEDDGRRPSVLASMNGLRMKMRENDDDRRP